MNEIATNGFTMESNRGSENQGKVNGGADFAFSGGNEVLRKLDRENRWLAAALLSFALFVLTLAGQDQRGNVADPLTEHKLTGNDALANPKSSMLPNSISLNAHSAGTKTTSRETLTVDPPILSSKIHQSEAQANATPMPSVDRHDIARVIRLEMHNLRASPVRHRFVGVKLRLIELWHQSLAQNEPSRSSTILWNSEKRKIRNRLRR